MDGMYLVAGEMIGPSKTSRWIKKKRMRLKIESDKENL